MIVYGTPRSHFTRKVLILLDHLKVPYDLADIGNVATPERKAFAGNPAMNVPVLKDEDIWMIESDHIASYIVRTNDLSDIYRVLTTDINTLNARSIMNTMMANEVKIILAERTGTDVEAHTIFRKAKLAIEHSLDWLDQHTQLFNPENPTYLDFHFISLWDHLTLYKLVALDFPSLQSIAEILHQQALIAKSAPPPFE